MKRIILLILVLVLMGGGSALTESAPPQKVVSLYGSFAEAWLQAGGALCLVPPSEASALPPELTARPAVGEMPMARYTLMLAKAPTPAARRLLELAELRKLSGDFDYAP